MRNNNAAESDISHVSAFTGQRLTQRTCSNCSPRLLDNDDNLDFFKILFVQLRTLKGKALHHTCVFVVGYTGSVASDASFKEARQHWWYDYSQEQRLCSLTHISKFTVQTAEIWTIFSTNPGSILFWSFTEVIYELALVAVFIGILFAEEECFHPVTLNSWNNEPVWCKNSLCGFW